MIIRVKKSVSLGIWLRIWQEVAGTRPVLVFVTAANWITWTQTRVTCAQQAGQETSSGGGVGGAEARRRRPPTQHAGLSADCKFYSEGERTSSVVKWLAAMKIVWREWGDRRDRGRLVVVTIKTRSPGPWLMFSASGRRMGVWERKGRLSTYFVLWALVWGIKACITGDGILFLTGPLVSAWPWSNFYCCWPQTKKFDSKRRRYKLLSRRSLHPGNHTNSLHTHVMDVQSAHQAPHSIQPIALCLHAPATKYFIAIFLEDDGRGCSGGRGVCGQGWRRYRDLKSGPQLFAFFRQVSRPCLGARIPRTG